MINKEATAARRLRLNAFFQQVGKIMFPIDWDDTEAASFLTAQASRTADEKLRAAQKRGAEVDEELCEQLLGGSDQDRGRSRVVGEVYPAPLQGREGPKRPAF